MANEKDEMHKSRKRVAQERFRKLMERYIDASVYASTEDMVDKRKRAACRKSWERRIEKMSYEEVLKEFEQREGYEALELDHYWRGAYKSVMGGGDD